MNFETESSVATRARDRNPTRDAAGLRQRTESRARQVTAEAGQPLASTTRQEMESAFGYDFGKVRVHADDASAQAARGVAASAYTIGSHVVFDSGHFAPETTTGKHLLAHELAHVVQQDRGSTAPPSANDSATNAALEMDANRAAASVDGGGAAAVNTATSGNSILRQPAERETTPPPAPRKPRREERFNVGRGGKRVDAELDRDAGWLTVKMKLKFQAVNNPSPWPSPARFEEFKAKFMEGVARRWSFKHYLVPARPCPGEPELVAVRVQPIPVTSGEHFTVKAGYTTTFQRSSVSSSTKTADLDVLDVEEGRFQTPGEHEFGHMLGLPHIHCPRNDDECYGTNFNERSDIMGAGSFVSPLAYEPFAELMYYFTGCNYNVKPASQIPTSRAPDIGGAIGFLGGGVIGGLLGAALGPLGLLAGAVVGAVGGYFAGRGLGKLVSQP
jgi:hypothetical protein